LLSSLTCCSTLKPNLIPYSTMQHTPVLVLNATTKRETGRKAQLGNITAGKAVADIIRTSLGPRAMLKMILSQSGSIVITNDGNAILREIDVSHPAAKSMIELSRAQDEEVGDGTTSVIILAGEMLAMAERWLELSMHPRLIINAYTRALDDAIKYLESIAVPVDPNDKEEMMKVIQSTIGTKFISKWNDLMCKLAYEAVRIVTVEGPDKRKEVDLKRYCKIEKIPGGEIEESMVFPGAVLNKDVIDGGMRRRIENPRVIILDCGLEFKKGESQLTVEAKTDKDLEEVMRQEELAVKKMVDDILKHKPDLVISEKGISDLAQHYFKKAGVSALRRMRKTDSNRIARAVGARIVQRTDEIKESDVGTGCALFEVRKIGDEYFSFLQGKNPKACTIILRGAGKDMLQEIERNLNDALAVARNITLDPRLVPGGGASEMAVATHLREKSHSIGGVEQHPYHAVSLALEVIPRTLIQNCGVDPIRTLTALRAKHSTPGNHMWGIDGNTGEIVDIRTINIWEPLIVKAQTIKTAIEAACMLLKVDDIVSGISGKKGGSKKETKEDKEEKISPEEGDTEKD